jgi:hypothetical protein
MAAASGVAGTARPRLPAETGRAGFPRPFLFVPVTRPGQLHEIIPFPKMHWVEGWTARAARMPRTPALKRCH